MRRTKFLLFAALGISTLPARAQLAMNSYTDEAFGGEDTGAFSDDPTEIDTPSSGLGGKYFQTAFQLGSSILTGGLGTAYSPGFAGNAKFIFFFDRMWAAELSAGFAQHSGLYNATNTQTPGINIPISLLMMPVSVGLRYGFDQDRLSRGLSTMNPYVSINAELALRWESVPDSTDVDVSGLTPAALQITYGPRGVVANKAMGFNIGGGIEFDVYKKRVFMGVDLRYHQLFWSNSDEFFGQLNRQGNAFSAMASASYIY